MRNQVLRPAISRASGRCETAHIVAVVGPCTVGRIRGRLDIANFKYPYADGTIRGGYSYGVLMTTRRAFFNQVCATFVALSTLSHPSVHRVNS